MKMKIIIDLDSTILKFDEQMNKYIKADFGFEIFGEDVDRLEKSFLIEKLLMEKMDWSGKRAWKYIKDMWNLPGFWGDMEVYPNSLETVRSLAEDPRFHVVICSKVPIDANKAYVEKDQWFRSHFRDLWKKDEMHFFATNGHKWAVGGCVLIDDRPDEAEAAVKHDVFPIIFSQRWNTPEKLELTEFQYFRSDDWVEIGLFIEMIHPKLFFLPGEK